jgi:hypothetical protein
MSELKVNKISPRSGTDVTLGDSGDTFTLGSGANIAGLTLSDNILFDTASKGIYLGTTSATASNLLDDYEEGTWTPTYTASGGGTASYAGTTGNYVKVGKIVHIQMRIMTTTESFSGDVTVTGLPFTSDSTQWRQSALSVIGSRLGTDMPNLSAFISNNTTVITLHKSATNDYNSSAVTDADLVNNTNYNILKIAGSYEIS